MQDKEYKWDANDYASHSSAQLGWARELIARLDLCGSEDVLDIGCGEGKITAMLAELVVEGSVTGIDRSAEMVALAQKRFPSNRHENLRFRRCDVRELGEEAAYDVAFSNATLHWIKDHASLLRRVSASSSLTP